MRTPRSVVAVAAAAACVALVFRGAPTSTPPLYDGVCPPVSYQYVSPPASVSDNVPPAPVSKDVQLVGGAQPVTEVSTNDNSGSPQAQMIANDSTFVPPAGATAVTLSITAEAPSAAPENGTIDGNVYRFAASAQGHPLSPRKAVTIVLVQALADSRERVIDERVGDHWVELQTSPLSNCVGAPNQYGASATSLGEFAVVIKGTHPPAAPPPTTAPLLQVAAVATGIMAIAVATFLIRRLRLRSPAPRRR